MATEAKEKELINRYLIDDNITEDDGFNSSDESYDGDADSYKKEKKNKRKMRESKKSL
jgi:hypothetical protein